MTSESEVLECDLNNGDTHTWKQMMAAEVDDQMTVHYKCGCGATCMMAKPLSQEAFGPSHPGQGRSTFQPRRLNKPVGGRFHHP